MKGFCVLPLLLLAAFLCLHIADSAAADTSSSCPKSFKVSSEDTATSKAYAQCLKLPQLDATLSWTYDPTNGSVDLAFRAKPGSPTGWVAWGINPAGEQMIGTQSLIALRQSNGTMACNTYNVTSKRAPLQPSPISIATTDLSSEYENGLMTIFAKVVLSSKKSKVSHVWEVGSAAKGLNPSVHGFANANLQSMGSIDFAASSSSSTSTPAPPPKQSPSSSSGSITRSSLTQFLTVLSFLGFSVIMFCSI